MVRAPRLCVDSQERPRIRSPPVADSGTLADSGLGTLWSEVRNGLDAG